MALRILTTDFPVAFAGDAYSLRVQVLGGTAPYTFAATGLPTGISLNTTTGELTATAGAISGTVVGDYTATITVTDAAVGTTALAETLTVRPASFRRARALVVDQALQGIIQDVDQSVVTRERLTTHFSENPAGVQANLTYTEDTYAHWSSQIMVGAPGDDVTAATTLDAELATLAAVDQKIAEPQFIEVTALTPTAGAGSTVTPLDVTRDHSIFITEVNDGPIYDTFDDAKGYPAVAMKFTPTRDMTIGTLTLDFKREATDQTGNILVTICRGNSATEIQSPAGPSAALAYGDGTQILGSGVVDVTSLPVGVWQATAVSLVDAALTLSMTAGLPYYIVVSSDYVSPGPHYVELGVSTTASVLAANPIDPPVIVEATPGTPHSDGFESGSVYAQYVDDGAAALTYAFSASMTVTLTSQDGVSTITQVDAAALNTNERFWLGASPLDAIRLLMTNPSGTGFVDFTDGSGNSATLVSVTDGASGTAVDADGYLTNEDLIIQVTVAATGLLPPVPFYVYAGAERRLTALAPDAMLRGARIR